MFAKVNSHSRVHERAPDPRPPLEDAEIKTAVVVVPCHNESDRLDVDRFVGFVNEGIMIHVLFVNDGSTDNTAEILDRAVSRVPDRIHALHLPQNVGKGNAVRLGLLHGLELGAELVAYLDADLATPLPEMGRLISIQRRAGFDVILGSRVAMLGHDIQRALSRHYLGRIYSTAASFALGFQVYDTQCGAKLFRCTDYLEQSLQQPFRTRWVFDVELLARLSVLDPQLLVLEVPLRHWADIDGSKVKLKDMIGASADLALLTRDLVADRRARTQAGHAVLTDEWDDSAWNNRRRRDRRVSDTPYTGPDRRSGSRRSDPKA
jgi:dolichyl-phosphate beta-glucosyltransferase